MSQKRNTTEGGVEEAARDLTLNEAGPLLDELALVASQDESEIAVLLTLLAAAAYSKNFGAEDLYQMTRDRLMPYVRTVTHAADAFVAESITAARRGAQEGGGGDD